MSIRYHDQVVAGGGGISREKLDEALAAKQDKLGGVAGQVVGFDGMGLARAVDGWSNPNLLSNWCFVDPVNQRVQTEYSGDGYTIDRWKIEGGLKVTPENGWLKVINETDEDGWFIQCAEPSLMSELAGRTITHSAFCKGEGTNLTIYWGYIDDGNWHSVSWAQIPTDGIVCVPQLTTVFPEVTAPTVFQIFGFGVYAHSTLWIRAAKAELGSRQTLAHQDGEGNWVLNDPPPDKALELTKCQRYYQVFSSASLRPANAEDFRPPMRVNPALGTITINGVTYYTADANL